LNFLQFVTAKFILREILTKERSGTEQAYEWKQKHSSKPFHPGSDWTMVKEDNTVRVKAAPNGNTLTGIEIRSDENILIQSTRNNGI
jgi:hypothetical protein